MGVGFWQGVWTLVALVIFLGIVIWTFSPRRRREFERAARMPLEEDAAGSEESRKEQEPDG